MNTLAYSFDLGAEDYIAMNMHPWRNARSWYRSSVKSAGAVLLVIFLLLAMFHMQVDWAFLAALAVAGAYFLASPWLRRHRYVKCLRQHYSQPPADRLMGAHTLTIGPEGIESSGPYHRTFRAWPAVTEACVTPSYALIYTIFGNVYILPGRAMNNPGEVREALESHLPAGCVRAA